jgi:4-methyl-5(b-hydroxyethyl)-thiazole monophosphate biosynthesis
VLQRQQQADKLIGCICAAPLLLLDAGLTTNLRYTCHPTVVNELTEAITATVVQDGRIITSSGAGTATEFALQLIDELCEPTTSKTIAESICWFG